MTKKTKTIKRVVQENQGKANSSQNIHVIHSGITLNDYCTPSGLLDRKGKGLDDCFVPIILSAGYVDREITDNHTDAGHRKAAPMMCGAQCQFQFQSSFKHFYMCIIGLDLSKTCMKFLS